MDPNRPRSASPQGKPAIHETKPANETAAALEHEVFTDEQLRNIQTIESGGPPKKVNMDQLPAPIRYFGYFCMSGIALFVVISILISIFK
ncbi:hypothetical protein FHS19_006246 [Paenibacillus rhizosphaerae]|uniref:Amino acid transporter n=1 Tax=Paenibacillus rhizosphaerae TaxID=297318 RepID=A0A839TYF6_9BACL|nr:hypothetical protein [Paenibacillus rhizosphaerae]MBB3131523.1 hypothetical protein [Paenibacillus rhizosphaerae]